jgi:hypothetical protein
MMLYDDLTSEKRQIFQLLRLQHQFFTIVISTLRFNFLVSSEALLATGLVPPNPFPLILFYQYLAQSDIPLQHLPCLPTISSLALNFPGCRYAQKVEF